MLQLWISPGACSLLPHILLHEISATFDLVVIDIIQELGFPSKYAHINPKKRLPILILDSSSSSSPQTIITETVAITTYISSLSPSSHLLGTSTLETVRCYEWFNWLSGTFHERGFGAYFAPFNFADEESAYEAVRRKARGFVEQCYEDVEGRLREKEKDSEGNGKVYAVGKGFTAVDVFLYIIYRWGHMLRLDMKGRYPKYTALVGEVVKREAVRKAVEREGIPILEDDRADSADPREGRGGDTGGS